MGWAHGTNYEGRGVGYGVRAVCEEPGCRKAIDLGLAYCCGDLPGVEGEAGCGHYFCGEHLYYGGGNHRGARCTRCLERIRTGEEEPFETCTTCNGLPAPSWIERLKGFLL